MQKFLNRDMADLAHQLTLSPRRLVPDQVRGIDALLALIETDRAYPFEFVCYHITKYRKRGDTTGFSIPGKVLIEDLVTLAEFITRRANLTLVDLAEPVCTHQELADELNVSTKTIRRWRTHGLMGVRVVYEDGVNRLAFCRRTIDRFVARHGSIVSRAAAFKQLSCEERDRIIARAREIVRARPLKLHAVAKLIAEECGRAVETIRYTLRRFDESANGSAIFRSHSPDAPSAADQRREAIRRCHEAGDDVATIARTFECTEMEVQRALTYCRAVRLKETSIDFVANELFFSPSADAIILESPEPRGAGEPSSPRIPKDLPSYLRSLYLTPLLSSEQEQDVFRRYNYLKFKAARAIEALDVRRAAVEEIERIEGWIRASDEVKQRIIRANLRLVVSVAKKHVGWSPCFYEVVSDGNVSLMRAVEKFDYARGYKFSTYACWAIMKNYARSVPEAHYHSRRHLTGQEELLEAAPDRSEVTLFDGDRQQMRDLIAAGMKELTDREREILDGHYGLSGNGASLTLEQLGQRFGVTKERIRQIERRAMEQLRQLLAPSLADALSD